MLYSFLKTALIFKVLHRSVPLHQTVRNRKGLMSKLLLDHYLFTPDVLKIIVQDLTPYFCLFQNEAFYTFADWLWQSDGLVVELISLDVPMASSMLLIECVIVRSQVLIENSSAFFCLFHNEAWYTFADWPW